MRPHAPHNEPATLPSATLVLVLGALQVAVLIILLMLTLPATSRAEAPCARAALLAQPQTDANTRNCLRSR